jgi:xylulose-5-phosphate/fructose-6-phosphate phosphoketolase
MEEGTTTTPFDVSHSILCLVLLTRPSPPQMMLSNHVSRFHVAAAAIRGGALHNPEVSVNEHELVSALMHEAEEHKKYALKHATDKPEVYQTPTF